MRKTICFHCNMAESNEKLQLVQKKEKESEKTNLDKTKTRKNRGVVWQDDATNFLIDVWGEEVIQLQLENCKTSKQTSKIYEAILIQLQTNGHCEGFTARDVVNKVKKLRQKYKTEKDKKRRSGTGKGKEWKFFSKLDAFLSTKPNVEPLIVVDTMAANSTNEGTTRPEAEKTDDIVEDMIKKYGKSQSHIQKCNTCEYEQVINSAGVMNLESGSVRVYADDDEFSCPNCENTGTAVPNCDSTAGSNCGSTSGLEETLPLDSDDDVSENVQSSCTGSAAENKNSGTFTNGIKKRKKSNVEKSLDVVFQKLQENTKDEFLRLKKWEEEKMKKEHEFRLEQMALENQRRREDREHEMNLLRLLVQNPQGTYPTNPVPYSYPAVTIATPLAANVFSMASTSSSYDTVATETDTVGKKTYFSL